MGHISFTQLPAGVSLAAACIDTLGQGVLQSGIDYIQIDWLLVHLTAWVPVLSYIKGDETERCKHCANGQSVNTIHSNPSKKCGSTEPKNELWVECLQHQFVQSSCIRNDRQLDTKQEMRHWKNGCVSKNAFKVLTR